MRLPERGQIIGLTSLGLIFAAAGAASLTFPIRAQIFPLFVGILGTVLALAEWWSIRRMRADRHAKILRTNSEPESWKPSDITGVRTDFYRTLPYLFWLLGLFALVALVGFVSAAAIFAAAFLRREANIRWILCIVSSLAVLGSLLVLGNLFSLRWPLSLVDPLRALGLL